MSDERQRDGLTLEQKRARLAEALRRAERLEAAPVPGAGAPLSFAQERLWFVEQMVPGTPLYNLPVVLRLRGTLDAEALGRAIGEIARRHDTLRTVFAVQDGQPVQVVTPFDETPFAREPLPLTDLGRLPARTREETALAQAAEAAGRPFDLSRGPLFGGRLFRVTPTDHVLLLNQHHIISDGWSIGVLFRELGELYGAFAAGRPSPLDPLGLQYAGYAAAQRRRLAGEYLAGELDHWAARLAGLPPVLDLPGDRPRPPVPTFRGGQVMVRLPPPLVEGLTGLCRRERVTSFMFFLAAYFALLGRYTGAGDLVVGCPIAGRTRTEVEGLIGLFVNTLALRANLADDPPFGELLARVKRAALEAYDHQEVPFERLVAELAPERSLSYHPIFQTAFTLDDGRSQAPRLPGLETELIPMPTPTSKFDLTLSLTGNPGEATLAAEYSADLFERDTADRLLGHYRALVESALADPGTRVSRLGLLPEDERRDILGPWARSPRPYPRDRCIHELFEEQARATPEAPALLPQASWRGEEPGVAPPVTYAELDRRADEVAGRLLARGVGPDTLVGLCAERSLEMIAALLGILKAGGAYLQLDPTYPPERLAFLLEDSRARVVLTQAKLSPGISGAASGRADLLLLDEPGPPRPVGSPEAAKPRRAPGPDDLAYVVCTSGSTGRPKGVAVPHRAVVRLAKEANYARLTADAVFIQLAPVLFDASTLEIWGPLLNGGRLVLPPPGTPSLVDLGDILRRTRVTTVFLTTALFNLMVEGQTQSLAGLRELLFGGETASAPHVRKALAELGGCQLVHVYGPTENTTFTTFRPLAGSDSFGSAVPIGRPIANTSVYVLDRNGEPVPAGVPGELYTGDDGLARGYLGRPDLTAERFVPDPFGEKPGGRLYRTGDLVQFLPGGDIEFLGRLDHQVKIRGFRVEPGEIEAALLRHPAVREAVVVAREDRPGERRLVAYVVPAETRNEASAALSRGGAGPLEATLRAYLARDLPEWMLPSAFAILDRLPLNPNGKVDRAALPEPSGQRDPGRSGPVAPRDGQELRLVEIWEDLLGVRPVGVTDNFFELGGHSLLAARMVARVEKDMGQRLPLTALFQTPTVEHLAGLLRERVRDLPYSPLVGLRTSGRGVPVFCPHAVGGLPHNYAALARRLGPDRRVYGFQARGLYGEGSPLKTIEEMAEAYLAAARSVQPDGPYHLVGYCLGGAIAFEMARRLRAAGETVGPLILVDSTAPPPPNAGTGEEPGWFMYAWELVNRGLEAWGFVEGLETTEPGARLPVLLRRAQEAGVVPPGVDSLPAFERWLKVYRATARAYLRYSPPPCPGPALLFKASIQMPGGAPDLGWGRLLGGREDGSGNLQIVDVEGDHYNVMAEPRVGALADRISATLERPPEAPGR